MSKKSVVIILHLKLILKFIDLCVWLSLHLQPTFIDSAVFGEEEGGI